MVTALGGAATWDSVKQIRWDVKVEMQGEVKALYHHAWDSWNARHRFETTSMKSYADAKAAGDDGLLEKTIAMYQLWNRDRGVAYFGKNELGAADRKVATAAAWERWQNDALLLALPYRLTEPGAYVKYVAENTDEHCPDGCDIIELSFDPSISGDKYFLNISRKSNRPEIVEIEKAGRTGRIAYKVADWTTVGGLQLPGTLDNVGARNMGDSEVWTFSAIRIGEPDDSLYIPQVR
jgi:hypothetical protein